MLGNLESDNRNLRARFAWYPGICSKTHNFRLMFHQLMNSDIHYQVNLEAPSQSSQPCSFCQCHLCSSSPSIQISLASQSSRFKQSKPVCFQFLTFHTWQVSGTLNAVIIWLMSKLFSISGNKYFWLIMTRGKGMKIYSGWISFITFVIFVAFKKKQLRKFSFSIAENGKRIDATTEMPIKLHS